MVITAREGHEIELDVMPAQILYCPVTRLNTTAGLSNRGIRDESERERNGRTERQVDHKMLDSECSRDVVLENKTVNFEEISNFLPHIKTRIVFMRRFDKSYILMAPCSYMCHEVFGFCFKHQHTHLLWELSSTQYYIVHNCCNSNRPQDSYC